MEFKKLFMTVVISALVIFAIISFIVITQNDNNASESILNNELINSTFSGLSSNLTSTQTDAQISSDVFSNVTPNENLGVWQVTPIVSPTKIFRSLMIGTWNVMIALPMKILGVSPIVASVMSSILILLIIIGVWAIWKGVINVN